MGIKYSKNGTKFVGMEYSGIKFAGIQCFGKLIPFSKSQRKHISLPMQYPTDNSNLKTQARK